MAQAMKACRLLQCFHSRPAFCCSGASETVPVRAGELKKGHYVMLKGFPCKVRALPRRRGGGAFPAPQEHDLAMLPRPLSRLHPFTCSALPTHRSLS